MWRYDVLRTLALSLALLPGACAIAQTFTTLHTFTATPYRTNSDGAQPMSRLVLADGVLYGTARFGGDADSGTVFKLNMDGSGFTTLHTFTGTSLFTNYDGILPDGGLVLSGNTLFRTTEQGGLYSYGTLYALGTDGSGFTTLYNFGATTNEGSHPSTGLVSAGDTLYGTSAGGSNGNGTVFSINTDGSGYTNVHVFSKTRYDNAHGVYTNGDGVGLSAALILAGSTLFGTCEHGGAAGNGTVFRVNVDGSGFTNLHSFTANPYPQSNKDGANPFGSLTLVGNTLYGTAPNGGGWANGTIFAVNTDGTGFTNLHNFTGTIEYTNSDGANPDAGLVLSGKSLYGLTFAGGTGAVGTVFKFNTNGTGFTVVYTFSAISGPYAGPYTNSDGANPLAALLCSGATFYGTTEKCGPDGNGTVFSLFLPPELSLTAAGTNAVVTWPTNAGSFTLQSATNLDAPAWTNVLPTPVIINGENVVTNSMSGTSMFYRLSK